MTKLLSMREAFGSTILKLAAIDPHLYVVSMDLKSSLCLSKFAAKYRNRFIECGVAESNAAAVAAGLAKSGKTVFLASYACFSPALNWGVIKQSIAYQRLNVNIVGAYAGLMTSALGASHQMLEDVALMRTMPNFEIFAPIDAVETSQIISAAAHSQLPSYIRLVRPPTPVISSKTTSFTIGKSTIIKSGKDITIVGYGPILLQAFTAQSQIPSISLEIINCSSIKPLDFLVILKSCRQTGRLIVIEDHQQNGGLGEAIALQLLISNFSPRFIHLAVNNQFGQSAKDYNQLWNHYGIGLDNLKLAIKTIIEKS